MSYDFSLFETGLENHYGAIAYAPTREELQPYLDVIQFIGALLIEKQRKEGRVLRHQPELTIADDYKLGLKVARYRWQLWSKGVRQEQANEYERESRRISQMFFDAMRVASFGGDNEKTT